MSTAALGRVRRPFPVLRPGSYRDTPYAAIPEFRGLGRRSRRTLTR